MPVCVSMQVNKHSGSLSFFKQYKNRKIGRGFASNAREVSAFLLPFSLSVRKDGFTDCMELSESMLAVR